MNPVPISNHTKLNARTISEKVSPLGAVNHKAVIEGVGGIAHFVQTGMRDADNGRPIVNTDVTPMNLEFSGADKHGKHEGGVAVAGGNGAIGGEGAPYSNAQVQIVGSTLMSAPDRAKRKHRALEQDRFRLLA